MGRSERVKQVNAYAMNYGLWFGLWWLLGFVWLVWGYSGTALLHTLFLLQIVSVPFVGVWFCLRFRREVEADGRVRFGEAYLFSVLLYLYAGLILAIGMWCYLRFLDGGQFVAEQIAAIESLTEEQMPGWTELRAGLDASVAELGYEDITEWMHERLSAAGMSANALCFSMMFGLVIGFLDAAITSSLRRIRVKG